METLPAWPNKAKSGVDQQKSEPVLNSA